MLIFDSEVVVRFRISFFAEKKKRSQRKLPHFLFLPKKSKVRKEKTLRLHFSPGCLRLQGCDNPQTRCAQTGVATTALPPPAAFPVRND